MLKPVALVVCAALALGIAGCGTPSPRPAADDVIQVVASTNVYGDIAQTVGGPDVEVTSVIDDPAQDPHVFEANARVQLALSRADIVIVSCSSAWARSSRLSSWASLTFGTMRPRGVAAAMPRFT